MTSHVANEPNPVAAVIGRRFPDVGSAQRSIAKVPGQGAQDYFITTSF